MAYRIGDRARFSFSFQSLGTTTPDDPPVVKVIHRDGEGVETVWTLSGNPDVVIRESTGNYHVDVQLLNSKTHYFRAIGAGDPELEKTTEIAVVVEETAFTEPMP